MDMAVGVIIGGAFKAIADSLTADIIIPSWASSPARCPLPTWSVTVGGQ